MMPNPQRMRILAVGVVQSPVTNRWHVAVEVATDDGAEPSRWMMRDSHEHQVDAEAHALLVGEAASTGQVSLDFQDDE